MTRPVEPGAAGAFENARLAGVGNGVERMTNPVDMWMAPLEEPPPREGSRRVVLDARGMVAKPQAFDGVATTNLFGDVLSDISAEAMGGMPLAPSAALGDGHAYFEPCRGSGLDSARQGLANPTAAIPERCDDAGTPRVERAWRPARRGHCGRNSRRLSGERLSKLGGE